MKILKKADIKDVLVNIEDQLNYYKRIKKACAILSFLFLVIMVIYFHLLCIVFVGIFILGFMFSWTLEIDAKSRLEHYENIYSNITSSDNTIGN